MLPLGWPGSPAPRCVPVALCCVCDQGRVSLPRPLLVLQQLPQREDRSASAVPSRHQDRAHRSVLPPDPRPRSARHPHSTLGPAATQARSCPGSYPAQLPRACCLDWPALSKGRCRSGCLSVDASHLTASWSHSGEGHPWASWGLVSAAMGFCTDGCVF